MAKFTREFFMAKFTGFFLTLPLFYTKHGYLHVSQ